MERNSNIELQEKINKIEQEVEFYKTIADNTFDWEVFRAPDGKITYVNQAFEKITGFKSTDWINGKISPKDFIHPDDMEKAQASIKKALNKEAINDLELRVINTDKQTRYINLCSQPVYKNNRFIGVRTSIRDITEQNKFKNFQKVYESLKESERKFKAYIINSPIAIFIADSEGKYTFVNPVVCKLLGYSQKEMLQLSIPQILPADKVNIGLEHFKKLQQTGEIQNTEIQFIRKDKTLIDVVLDTIKLSDNEYIAYVKDITHIKETEKQLKKQIDDYAKLNQEYLSVNEEYKSSNEQLNKAQAIAKENEVKFINQLNFTNALVKHLPIPVFYKDNEGKYIGCNPAYEDFTGIMEKQIIGKTDIDIWPQDLAKKFRDADLEMIQGNKTHHEYEFKFKDKNGNIKNIVTTKSIFYNQHNKPSGIVGAYLEITKHRQTEKFLLQHSKRLKILYELNQMSQINIEDIYDYILERSLEICNSKIGFLGFLNDEETIVRIHAWSASAMEICEVKEKFVEFEVEKTGIWGEVIRQRKPIIINDYKADNPLKRGTPGGHVAVHNYLSIPYFEQGKIIAIIAVGNKEEDYDENDIKELTILMEYAHNKFKQKQFELELVEAKDKAEESEKRFKALHNASFGGIAIHDKGKIMDCNQGLSEITGYSLDELIGMDGLLLISESTRDLVMNNILSGYEKPYEATGRKKNGEEYPIRLEARNIPYQGKMMRVVEFRDITEQKNTEKALILAKEKAEKNEKKYRTIFEGAPLGIFRSTKKGRFIEVNQALANMLGYDTPTQVVHSITNIAQQIYAKPPKRVEVVSQTSKIKISKFQNVYKRKDGEIFYANLYLQEIEDEQGKTILEGIVEDVTQTKEYEKKLKLAKEKAEASEEKHRLLFENMTQGVVYHNDKGEVIYTNQAAANILGLTIDQLYGKTSFDPRWKAVDEEGNSLPGEEHPISITLKTLKPVYSFIMGVTIPEIKEYRWISINSIPIFNPKTKELSQVIVTFEDISQRKQAEKERLMKEKLKKEIAIAEESLKFKQNFLANMSHEIRTPLTGILGMVDVLRKTKLNTDQKDYLNTIFQSGENLREIINNVLDFSKIEAGKMQLKTQVFQLETLIINAHKLFKSICFKSINFDYEIDTTLPKYIKADENRLTQIINNLVSNAVKFTAKGKITMHMEKLSALEQSEVKIKISISDTGKGISTSKQKKLFEPFSQIHGQDFNQFEGTGLGLSICKELAQLHGGKIGVNSEPGKGSTFWFTFLAEKADENDVQPIIETKKERYKKSLNILLVEDVKVNQKVFKLLLSSLGHTITIAENGLKALEIFVPSKFDLVLMDIQMPVLNGVEATKKLKEKYSKLPPIVGLSANAFEGDRERYMAEGLDEYLTKPLKEDEFNAMVKKLFI